MPLIAAFWSSVVGGVIEFFGSRLAKKIAIATAAVAAFTALVVTLFAVLNRLLDSISASISNESIIIGLGIVWPTNTNACITAIITAEVAVYVFKYKKLLLWASFK